MLPKGHLLGLYAVRLELILKEIGHTNDILTAIWVARDTRLDTKVISRLLNTAEIVKFQVEPQAEMQTSHVHTQGE